MEIVSVIALTLCQLMFLENINVLSLRKTTTKLLVL